MAGEGWGAARPARGGPGAAGATRRRRWCVASRYDVGGSSVIIRVVEHLLRQESSAMMRSVLQVWRTKKQLSQDFSTAIRTLLGNFPVLLAKVLVVLERDCVGQT